MVSFISISIKTDTDPILLGLRNDVFWVYEQSALCTVVVVAIILYVLSFSSATYYPRNKIIIIAFCFWLENVKAILTWDLRSQAN